ncbi:UNVERIFIED_CONTAM: hypothetical protein HDU68_006302 [Siphonaria sp. JEL0065]|nr:hypothetical protein HDU68_006302 [Siphonaria sp. JEL0065]
MADVCVPNKCNPRQTTIHDANIDTTGTFWQSTPVGQVGMRCPDQYLQYDMSTTPPATLANMTILYGNQSFLFDGQTAESVTTGPVVTVNSRGATPVTAQAGKDYTFSSTVATTSNGSPARLDTFVPLSNLIVSQVEVVRFTWNNLVLQPDSKLCQMNVMEVRVLFVPVLGKFL